MQKESTTPSTYKQPHYGTQLICKNKCSRNLIVIEKVPTIETVNPTASAIPLLIAFSESGDLPNLIVTKIIVGLRIDTYMCSALM